MRRGPSQRPPACPNVDSEKQTKTSFGGSEPSRCVLGQRGSFDRWRREGPNPILAAVARYRIDDKDAAVSIEVTDAAGQQHQLLEAFGECQAGRCSCPTDEYHKLALMNVQQDGDVIRIRLEPRAGQVLDTTQIAACLDYTTATASDTTADV